MRFYIDVLGDCVGKTSLDVTDEGRASIEAVRFAGELLRDNPEAILEDGIEVSISDADGPIVGFVYAQFRRMAR